jgi:hypothetical protein
VLDVLPTEFRKSTGISCAKSFGYLAMLALRLT